MLTSVCLLVALASTVAAATPTPAEAYSTAVANVADRVAPAVVAIEVEGYHAAETPGGVIFAKGRSEGTGFFISSDGYILTNNHVVKMAERVIVRVPVPAQPGQHSVVAALSEPVVAKIVGVDEECDLAVLKIDGKDFPFLPQGESEALRAGDVVMAFGSPFGFERSVTAGIVSNAARQVEPDADMVYIQTDTTINPGNSGGPLVNTSGQWIGVNTFIYSPTGAFAGLGFSVPSHIAADIAGQLEKDGRVRRGLIGANAQTITPAMRMALHLPAESKVILADVLPGSPAEDGKLGIGDTVLSLDGKPMENARQFDVNIYKHRMGDKITVSVSHGGQKVDRVVTVGERSAEKDSIDPASLLVPELGIVGLSLSTPELHRKAGARAPGGVLVLGMSELVGSDDKYLQPGDVIQFLNGESVADLAGLKRLVGAIPKGSPFVLHVAREGILTMVTVW